MKNQINNLTEKQRGTFNTLVQLGDSEELALETVLAMKETTQEELDYYTFAYTH
tara:strand:+ start:538 stop:699 length:162 start_codon:yes stop_codon:yes gene_type:complete